VVGLFGVCAEQGTQDVSRDGTVINVNVTNLRTANVTCQLPESTYELDIDLPGAFVSGTQYIVNVNGKAVPFTAQ
jgi:CheY-specific phosphatase CheX